MDADKQMDLDYMDFVAEAVGLNTSDWELDQKAALGSILLRQAALYLTSPYPGIGVV